MPATVTVEGGGGRAQVVAPSQGHDPNLARLTRYIIFFFTCFLYINLIYFIYTLFQEVPVRPGHQHPVRARVQRHGVALEQAANVPDRRARKRADVPEGGPVVVVVL